MIYILPRLPSLCCSLFAVTSLFSFSQTQLAEEVVKPLPKQGLTLAQQKSLEKAKKLSAQLLKEKTQFHKLVMEGKLDPFAEQRAAQ